jgi:hypothetical protein
LQEFWFDRVGPRLPASPLDRFDRTLERPGGHLELTFRLVHCDHDVFAGCPEKWFGKRPDSIALADQRLGDGVEFCGNRGDIWLGHAANLFRSVTNRSVASPA